MAALDAIDRNILRLLRLDARRSNASLAGEVGLSPSACLRRIKLMEQAGVIRGYTALVDTSNVEATIAVIINITLDRQTGLSRPLRSRDTQAPRNKGVLPDDRRIGLSFARRSRQCR